MARIFTLLVVLAFAAQSAAASDLANKRDAVTELVNPMFDSQICVGAAIGLIDGDDTLLLCFGRLDVDADRTVDERTLFEIGSVTKTFTALLLALAVERGTIAFDDPVKTLLPEGKRMPAYEDEEILLLHLATHTSALPRLPDNLDPPDPTNPYAHYDARQLYIFLSYWGLTGRPGGDYLYSNLGMGLLGHALSVHAGTTYEALVREQICTPLGMNDTAVKVAATDEERFARGHNSDGEIVSYWDLDALAGAGALRSTVADLVTYVRAQLGVVQTPLQAAMAMTHTPRAPADGTGSSIGLGWHIGTDGFVEHGGGTGGFATYVGFDPERKIGIVVLGNAAASQVHSLAPKLKNILRDEPWEPLDIKPIAQIDPGTLDRYVGRFRFFPGFDMEISLTDSHLVAQATGQQAFRIYPASELEFFYRVVPAEITFVPDDDGVIRKLILHQAGRDMPADRVIE